MIALMLALCGALPDSSVPPPRATGAGSEAGDSAVAQVPVHPVDSPVDSVAAGAEAPSAAAKGPRDPSGGSLNSLTLGLLGSMSLGVLGVPAGGVLLTPFVRPFLSSSSDRAFAPARGMYLGCGIGSAIGSAWGIVRNRSSERRPQPVIVPFLGGLLGFGAAFILVKPSSDPRGIESMVVPMLFAPFGALLLDDLVAPPKSQSLVLAPLIDPDRSGLLLQATW